MKLVKSDNRSNFKTCVHTFIQASDSVDLSRFHTHSDEVRPLLNLPDVSYKFLTSFPALLDFTMLATGCGDENNLLKQCHNSKLPSLIHA